MGLWSYYKMAYGIWGGLLRLALYPVILLLTMPVQLARTLWNCRVLFDCRFERYGTQFNAFFAVNNTFYSYFADICQERGRYGVTRLLGMGEYDLSSFFVHTPFSLYMLRILGCALPLIGMFGWLLSHALWTMTADPLWVALVMTATGLGSLFFAATFALQPYHVVGWLFFPLGVFALHQQLWWLAAAAWLAVSFGSFPAAFMAGLLCLFLSIWNLDPAPLLTVIPAGLKLLPAFLVPVFRKGITASVVPLVNAMGFARVKPKHATAAKGFFSNLTGWDCLYWLLVCGQYNLVLFLVTGRLDRLVAISSILLLVNFARIRFHDEITVFMLHMCTGTAAAMLHPDPWVLASFWLYISPLPFYLHIPPTAKTPHNRVMGEVPVYGPVDMAGVYQSLDEFFKAIPEGSSVLFATAPKGTGCCSVLGPYREQTELFRMRAVRRDIALMPDCLACIEYNYEGAPDLTGHDAPTVRKMLEQWQCQYVLGLDAPDDSSPWWRGGEFAELGRFSMGDHPLLREGWLGVAPAVDWVLLKDTHAE